MNASTLAGKAAPELAGFLVGIASRIFRRIAAAGFVVQWPWKIASSKTASSR